MIAVSDRLFCKQRCRADATDSSSRVRNLLRFGSLSRWSCDNRAIHSHSARNVTAGSTRVPARAGMRIATSATSVSSTGTAMNVNGS
jgi:hypothetical protein